AAMLIAFIALIALINFLLGQVPAGNSLWSQFTVPDWEYALGNILVTLAVAYLFVYLLERVAGRVVRLPGNTWGKRLLPRGIALLVVLMLLDGLLRVLPPGLSLEAIFSWVFSPVAFLMGLSGDDVPRVADLLGTKLVLNEFVAYKRFTEYREVLSPRARILATYALTGFANFASIGILLGGIGGIAPGRPPD